MTCPHVHTYIHTHYTKDISPLPFPYLTLPYPILPFNYEKTDPDHFLATHPSTHLYLSWPGVVSLHATHSSLSLTPSHPSILPSLHHRLPSFLLQFSFLHSLLFLRLSFHLLHSITYFSLPIHVFSYPSVNFSIPCHISTQLSSLSLLLPSLLSSTLCALTSTFEHFPSPPFLFLYRISTLSILLFSTISSPILPLSNHPLSFPPLIFPFPIPSLSFFPKFSSSLPISLPFHSPVTAIPNTHCPPPPTTTPTTTAMPLSRSVGGWSVHLLRASQMKVGSWRRK